MTPTRNRARQNLCNAISACFAAAMLIATPAPSHAGEDDDRGEDKQQQVAEYL